MVVADLRRLAGAADPDDKRRGLTTGSLLQVRYVAQPTHPEDLPNVRTVIRNSEIVDGTGSDRLRSGVAICDFRPTRARPCQRVRDMQSAPAAA